MTRAKARDVAYSLLGNAAVTDARMYQADPADANSWRVRVTGGRVDVALVASAATNNSVVGYVDAVEFE